MHHTGLKGEPGKVQVHVFRPSSTRQVLKLTGSHHYLGVWLFPRLTFRTQIQYLRERMQALTKVLRVLSWSGMGESMQVKRLFYIAAIRSVLDYCAPCLPGISQQQASLRKKL